MTQHMGQSFNIIVAIQVMRCFVFFYILNITLNPTHVTIILL